MILSELRDYVKQRGQASLSDIALHFDADPEVVKQMLNLWIRKGAIHKQLATISCGSHCQQCDTTTTEIYFWGKISFKNAPVLPNNCQHH